MERKEDEMSYNQQPRSPCTRCQILDISDDPLPHNSACKSIELVYKQDLNNTILLYCINLYIMHYYTVLAAHAHSPGSVVIMGSQWLKL